MSGELVMWDALALSRAIREREVSCVEMMTAYLDHIEAFNPRVNAIIAMADRESLLAQARERDTLLDRGEYLGWMHGFPQAVKDLADAAGFPTTEGSPIFADTIAADDAVFVRRIKDAGAIVIGKTNTPEFGLGSHSYNPVNGTTLNPYDTTRTAGGSSGGAGAALALRMLPVADGSDYMGSLRNPGAFNNVLGFRPSYGRVPTPGFVASHSTAGPMGRTVADVAMLLSTMAGPHPSAPLSLDEDPAVFAGPLEHDVGGARIAWVGDYAGRLATEPGVLDVCRSSFAAFESLGCVVEEARPDFDMDELWWAFRTHRHWDLVRGPRYELYADPEQRKRLKPEVVWEIENGLELSARDVGRALAIREAWFAAVTELFKTYDFVLAPSAQVFPFDATLHWPAEIDGRAMDTYHRWMETVAPWTLTGLPAMGMPAGFGDSGLPMGVQLIGRNHADLDVLRLSAAYESVTGWVATMPPPMLAAG